jgi:hypothetical protein
VRDKRGGEKSGRGDAMRNDAQRLSSVFTIVRIGKLRELYSQSLMCDSAAQPVPGWIDGR